MQSLHSGAPNGNLEKRNLSKLGFYSWMPRKPSCRTGSTNEFTNSPNILPQSIKTINSERKFTQDTKIEPKNEKQFAANLTLIVQSVNKQANERSLGRRRTHFRIYFRPSPSPSLLCACAITHGPVLHGRPGAPKCLSSEPSIVQSGMSR
ncbi:hypothetical protein CDAR_226461 [Caerostris darwini]|uniref:Uncharacterized protein n=1 Tax=Caerostris darwini TaxID=1538125 RepID=A0AAV4PYD4_9ARAC|nr:hypothetical protein CDAR_226461 [Caerostris darwini]